MRGMDCHGSTVATDPRFKGTYRTAMNADRYPKGADGSQLTVTTVVRRVENLRARQAESGRQAEGLFQSLLHEAFNG